MVISLFLPSASAIQITEVELNPEGSDSGSEWVEIYLEETINLESYTLTNNDGDIYELAGDYSDYFVIELDKQWLDNSDEKVFLKKESEIIFQTGILKDSNNDGLTWSLCDEEWIFIESTKGKDNDCNQEKIIEEENKTDNKKEEIDENREKEETITSAPNIQRTSMNQEPISLNSINEDNNLRIIRTKKEKTLLYISYAFTFFTVIIIIFLSLKKL